MALREITREIIDLVEEKSGIPVQVQQNKDLENIASVIMARKSGLPHHFIQYKYMENEEPDYLICFECGYILRIFQCPPEQRFDIYGTISGKEEVTKLLQKPGGIATKYRLNKIQAMDIASQMQSGLITHLRSVSVGLRISTWLAKEYPALKELEQAHVAKEIKVNYQNFQSEVKQITPPEIFHPTQIISAAYAIHWAEKYKIEKWSNPYILNGYEAEARKLLDIIEEIPEEPTHDRELIDAWGTMLEITDWYAYSKYEPYQG